MSIEVKPYFPTCRQHCLRTLDASGEAVRGTKECSFCWFICGKKVYDKSIDRYTVSLPSGTSVLCESTGQSYQTKDNVIIVLLPWSDPSFDVEETPYHGTANEKCLPNNNPVWCKGITITMLESSLQVVNSEECGVMTYSKQNIDAIRRKIPTFREDMSCKEKVSLLERYFQ